VRFRASWGRVVKSPAFWRYFGTLSSLRVR
jgi:hypothetical protein